VTGPVWDGQGRDPWLPQRLDARLEAAAVERDIRAAVWAALSDWLVQLARRVLRGDGRPDMDAVWAMAPLWRDAVDLILRGEVLKAIGLAFEKILGPGDRRWQQRPFVTAYLGEVRNRMVRIPEEVYDLVAGQVAQGVNLGESIPKIRDRVDSVLSTTGSERWPNRATVVARTETIGALNAGRHDAFRMVAADSDEPLEMFWLATDDHRTRQTHEVAEGQRVPVGTPFVVGGAELRFPGDPSGPPQEVIQCRCTMLLVEPGEDVDLSGRQMRRGR
jgi:F like protein